MIGFLIFYIKTTGDFETKKGQSIEYDKEIILSDDIEFSTALIDKSGIISKGGDYKTIFTSIYNFKKLINYAKDAGLLKRLKPEEKKDILNKNIQFIKDLFFQPKGSFYIYGNEYIISKSDVNFTNIKSFDEIDYKTKQKYTKFIVFVNLNLINASKPSALSDFKKLSCNDKALELDKQAKEIFDISLGLYKEKPIKYTPYSTKLPLWTTTTISPYSTKIINDTDIKKSQIDIEKERKLKEEERRREMEKRVKELKQEEELIALEKRKREREKMNLLEREEQLKEKTKLSSSPETKKTKTSMTTGGKSRTHKKRVSMRKYKKQRRTYRQLKKKNHNKKRK
jgi:hypothetical protein